MNRRTFEVGLLVAILVCGWSEALPHTRSESYSHWHLSENNVTGIVTIPLREVMVLYEDGNASIPANQLFESHLQKTISVQSGGEFCERTGSQNIGAAAGFIRIETQFNCGTSAPDEIIFAAMFGIAPAHVHYAKLHRNGIQIGEALLTGSANTWNIEKLDEGESWTFASFAKLGIEHIAGGLDHIAFLFGLLLIAGSTRRTVVAVTGFTLGHSVSLAAAVIGYVSADGRLVEAFIGFTVLLIAVEYFLLDRSGIGKHAAVFGLFAWLIGILGFLAGVIELSALLAYFGIGLFAASYLLIAADDRGQDIDMRSSVMLFAAACCFGLVHGFGFAGFLMETGLLGGDLFAPLLGFNLGVELGQLIIIAMAVVAAKLFGRYVPRLMPQLVAAMLCGVGVYWFVGRTMS